MLMKKINYDEAIKTLAKTHTATEIAKELGIVNSTVYRVCKRLGIKPQSNRMDPEYEIYFQNLDLLRDLHKTMTNDEIAKKFGISKSSLLERMYKIGFDPKRTKIKKPSKEETEQFFSGKPSSVTKNDIEDFAKKYNISYGYAWKTCKECGIQTAEAKRRKENDSHSKKFLEEKRKQHKNLSTLKKDLGFKSEGAVSALLKRNGVSVQKDLSHIRNNPDLLRKHIQEDKHTIEEIAKIYGVSSPSIKRWCDSYQIDTHQMFSQSSHKTRKLLLDKSWLEAQYKQKSSYAIANDLEDCSFNTVLKALRYHDIPYSPTPTSSIEYEVVSSISQYYSGNIEQNTRESLDENKEIDIWIPERQVGIEIDGVYWHSSKFKPDIKYHQNKKINAIEKGIKLFQIWDHEWADVTHKRKIIESMIRNALGISKKIYRASKCKIATDISSSQERIFCEENHIQGYTNSSYQVGLLCSETGELLALMTFRKPRYAANKYDYELIRFCVKRDTKIHGAASKLFQEFIKTHPNKSVVSYCNLRYGTGNVYTHLGFNQLGSPTPPSYIWSKGTKILSRYQTQKSNLEGLLGKDQFDPNLSESQNMHKNGYVRTYDSGNLVFVYKPI